MPSGGKRPGAGKPKGSKNKKTLEQQAAAELLRKRVSEEFEPLIQSSIDSAKGLLWGKEEYKIVHFKNENGKMIKKEIKELRVYKKPPDTRMLVDLLDRMVGKAIQPIGGQGDGLEVLTQAVRELFNIKE